MLSFATAKLRLAPKTISGTRRGIMIVALTGMPLVVVEPVNKSETILYRNKTPTNVPDILGQIPS